MRVQKQNSGGSHAAGVMILQSGLFTFEVDGHSLLLACASRPCSNLLKRRLGFPAVATCDERITACASAVRTAGAGIAAAAPAKSSTMNSRSLDKIGCGRALERQVWLKGSLDIGS